MMIAEENDLYGAWIGVFQPACSRSQQPRMFRDRVACEDRPYWFSGNGCTGGE